MRTGKEREESITKELKEAFETKRNVNFLNCGHDFISFIHYFISVCISQFLPIIT